MAHHTVTLNYQVDTVTRPRIPGVFKAVPDPVRVRPGDTLSFKLGVAPPNSTFKVKIQGSGLVSPDEVHDSLTKVTVHRAASTKYHCQLLDSTGKVVAESTENTPGGGIEPEHG